MPSPRHSFLVLYVAPHFAQQHKTKATCHLIVGSCINNQLIYNTLSKLRHSYTSMTNSGNEIEMDFGMITQDNVEQVSPSHTSSLERLYEGVCIM